MIIVGLWPKMQPKVSAKELFESSLTVRGALCDVGFSHGESPSISWFHQWGSQPLQRLWREGEAVDVPNFSLCCVKCKKVKCGFKCFVTHHHQGVKNMIWIHCGRALLMSAFINSPKWNKNTASTLLVITCETQPNYTKFHSAEENMHLLMDKRLVPARLYSKRGLWIIWSDHF